MRKLVSTAIKKHSTLTKFKPFTSISLNTYKQLPNFSIFNYSKQDDKHDEKSKNTSQQDDSKDSGNNPKPSFDSKTIAIIGATVIGVYIFEYLAKQTKQMSDKQGREITLDRFLNEIIGSPSLHHLIYDVKTNEVFGFTNTGSGQPDLQFYFKVLSPEGFQKALLEAEHKKGISAQHSTPIHYQSSINWLRILGSVAMIIVPYFLLNRFIKANFGGLTRGGKGMGGPFDMIKMDKLVKTKSTTTFADVAGMDEAKKEIMEFVSFLKTPEKYRALGARIPRGAILMGPPGTGKTLLAKAVAGEADVDFYSMSGSDFVEMYVGVGAARVRDLFAQARKSKSAIIYIDEIDAIGKPRGSGMGGNDEREGTLNQLLVELDGFQENENIIIFASTNVNAEDLDGALLRPGRFDRQISIDKPDLSGRIEIYKIHMRPLNLGPDISVDRLANLTPGFAGAEIHNVCNEAAIIAARGDAEHITMKHFEEAIERVVGGVEKKHKVISQDEKKAIAYHEAGHAIVAWFSKHCDPLLKISVIPRGQTLGYAQYVPIERHIHTFDHLMDILAQAIGGRAAEVVVFGEISTGARDDLQKITKIAYGAVSMYGMSSMGAISFPPPGSENTTVQKPYGESVARLIDTEVKEMVGRATNNAISILKEKRDLLDKVAEFLIKNEMMSTDQFRELAGPRPNEKHSEIPTDPVKND